MMQAVASRDESAHVQQHGSFREGLPGASLAGSDAEEGEIEEGEVL